MLAIYTLVFGVILQAKWANSSNTLEFALALFAGLIVFNFFAECLNRAPLLVVSNPGFVKKVVFPLEVFPWVSVGSALFHFTINVMVWMLFYLSVRGLWHVELLYLPMVMLPLVFLILGLSWLLSSIGVYIRDISQVTGLITTGLLFLSPVFYDISMIPEKFIWLYRLNPLTFVIQQARHVMLEGIIPDRMELTIYTVVSLLIAWLGLVCFQRTRHGFADVI
jgi:lipopolysaccharide transport system permease protein